MIKEILEYNRQFVSEKHFSIYSTTKYPDKKLAILSCMDTRLTELLPAALGLKNGDAKIIKNAGGAISHPYGSAVRSLLISIYELGVTEIMVIGHTDCGVQHLDSKAIEEQMIERGVSPRDLKLIKYSGVNFDKWLSGFESVEESVSNSVECLREHPLVPSDVLIQGFVMDSDTGALRPIE